MSLRNFKVLELPNGETIIALTFTGLQAVDPVDAEVKVLAALTDIVAKGLKRHDEAMDQTDTIIANLKAGSK